MCAFLREEWGNNASLHLQDTCRHSASFPWLTFRDAGSRPVRRIPPSTGARGPPPPQSAKSPSALGPSRHERLELGPLVLRCSLVSFPALVTLLEAPAFRFPAREVDEKELQVWSRLFERAITMEWRAVALLFVVAAALALADAQKVSFLKPEVRERERRNREKERLGEEKHRERERERVSWKLNLVYKSARHKQTGSQKVFMHVIELRERENKNDSDRKWEERAVALRVCKGESAFTCILYPYTLPFLSPCFVHLHLSILISRFLVFSSSYAFFFHFCLS